MDAGEGSDAERDVALRDVNKPIKYIFCEDAYGREFFRKLVSKLGENPLGIKVKSFKGPFDKKGRRVVAAAAYSAHKIIVVIDSEGKEGVEDAIINQLKDAVPQHCKLSVVVCENSIEDWLVANECKELKRDRGFAKRHLPGYAERIKPDILKQKSPSFRKFYESLLDP